MTQTTITYHISQGAGTKMYTLWQEIMSEHFYKCRFVQNLSIDKEKAFIKAKEIAGDRELYDDSVDQLKKIIREESGLINFGKYYGKSVNDVPANYLCWLADGGPITVTDDHDASTKYTKYLVNDILKENALRLAIELGLFVKHNEKFISKKLMEWIIAEDAGWGYHYPEKAKVTLCLKLVSMKSYETAYGRTYINTFVDQEGQKFQYKGSNPPYIEDKENWFNCSGSIKHAEYKDRKICQIQRIKMLNS